ncbi:class I adenylate-forming enzyme family protein [Actinomycetospora termitidis]|uniref:AMP-binding protein n=1 Tax=Actinomycetospora termitidis TaxID=3053470 RepID=A0ABT7MG86_9PSEU|nr:AMP-binding protein [Actinomycetospora sp. Odt1-22]MDL5158882.1 AMP-binding protein [Actinomycetospora sp. Odt1-22]
MLVHDIVRHHARARGGSVALVVGEQEYTYRALQDLVDRTAAALVARGIGHGDRVAVLAKNSLEYVQLYFATAVLGAILVPLNFWHRAGEHAYTIADAEPSLWFVEAGYDDVVGEARAAHPGLPVLRIPGPEGDRADWDAFLAAAVEVPPAVVADDDAHMILYTSGTTGRPKGAILSHRRTVDDALAMATVLRAHDRDVFMNYFPPFHVGNWDHMKPFLLMGGTVILLREFDPDVVLTLLPRHRVSVVLGVPTMLHALITHERFPTTDTSSIRLLYYGAYDPSGIMDRTAEALGAREGRVAFAHTYGLTEAGPFVTWCPPEDVFDRWGSVGRPMPGVDVALLDPDGAEVAPGEPGEICVRGPRMTGYWRNPEATATALAGGWLHTGDVAVADPDGFLTIVDRTKDMIRSGGQNVWSKEVEDCLARHPAVIDVAVIGAPDPVYEEQVVAVVVPRDGGSDELADELARFVKTHLAGYNTPRRVHFLDEFPRTAVGKIQKHVLRERFR